MKKNLLSLIAASAFVWSCGDAGFESDISLIVDVDAINVDIEIPADAIGQRVPETPPIPVDPVEVNITSNDFDDYDLTDIESFTINKISYTIQGFDAGSAGNMNEADLSVMMDVTVSGAQQNLLDILITDVQNNVEDVLLYDKSNPGSVNRAAITAMEGALLNSNPFTIDLELVGRDVLLQTQSQDFSIVFKFDVTARVQLID